MNEKPKNCEHCRHCAADICIRPKSPAFMKIVSPGYGCTGFEDKENAK
jgi:hypothetical protein